MKAVILAGGLGTRISEETEAKPKPMVTIGGMPIIWHIMKSYSHHGITEFIVCCGYKGSLIKEFFANYYLHMSDMTFDLSTNQMTVQTERAENWKVTLADTGELTMTGSRLKKVEKYLNKNENFLLTYGDGLSDVDIASALQFHEKHGKLATLTAVRPAGRFGVLDLDNNRVRSFKEKPEEESVNGGFFVLSPKVLKYIDHTEDCVWEEQPLQTLVDENELMAYQHQGFWQPMDTLRDRKLLESLWASGNAPWKTWD